MGSCQSRRVSPDYDGAGISDKQTKARTKRIDEVLAQQNEEEKRVVKCLLLGAGECGKSTILKQMKILHLNGFSMDERKNFKALIHKNTLDAIQTLCYAIENQLLLQWDNPENRIRSEEMLKINPQSQPLPLGIRDDLKHLYTDKAVFYALQRSNEFHLLDSATYFLDPETLNRTFSEAYVPTDGDILRSRLATTGIIETSFKIDKLNFKMFDVGGQRGERKKWIHCFDSVTAIMFIASLSEYDQVLAEDRSRNRLKESLDLFDGIINLPWFKEVPIILFLNKVDIFQNKVKTTDIGIYFPAYSGGTDYQAGLKFIQDEYFERNDNPLKTIYCHVTDATNTENIAFVWKATKHIILEQNLTRSGLLMC